MKDRVILCVEDNKEVQTFNKALLEAEGYTVISAMTIAEAEKALKSCAPSLIILDINMPDGNGLDFLRELRKTSNIPVLLLTVNNKDRDVVSGFDYGCDDYLPKPYTFPVLLARVEGLLRRASSVPEALIKGSLRLDMLTGHAFLNDDDLLLAQKEFTLLLLFLQNEGKTMSAGYIYEKAWGQTMNEDDNAVKNAVYRLRKKLAGSAYTLTFLRGKGYRFEKANSKA